MFYYHTLLILFLVFLLFFFTSFSIFSAIGLLTITFLILFLIIHKKLPWQKYFILLLLFLVSFSVVSGLNKKYSANVSNIAVKIVEEHPTYYIVKINYTKFYLSRTYYNQNQKNTIAAEIDDTLQFLGNFTDLKSINNFYEFDFKLFLNAQNINQQVVVNKSQIKIIHHRTIRNIIFNYIKTFPPLIKKWTQLLLFQQQTIENKANFKDFAQWGIAPIVVVSGIHINFFFFILSFLLSFLKKRWVRLLIIFMILLFYLYLLNWSIPAFRSFLFLLFQVLFKIKNTKNYSISILCFVAYCSLLFAPLQFYLLGWQLSFGISFLILFTINKLRNFKPWKRKVLMVLIFYLFALPIQWQLNHSFSLLSLGYNLFFTPIIIFYDLLLFLNLFLNPIMKYLTIPLLSILEFVVCLVKNFNLSIITFQPENWTLQLYFSSLLIIYWFFHYFNWKIYCIIAINISMISLLWTSSIIKPFYEITMINVGNAMSILITTPYQQAAMLVDAGTEDLNPNSNLIYNYITAKGISHLNAVFLTHHDLDHTSNINYLKSKLQIDKIYENIDLKPQYTIQGFNSIKNLTYNLDFGYASENNKSLVLLLQIYNFKIMFTGDIEKETEQLLINNNSLSKIDILQVAHHGSKTSSTMDFLNKVQPKIALISGHYKKNRQFPSQQTLDNLNKINAKTYYTGKNKTIIVRIYSQHYDIITLI